MTPPALITRHAVVLMGYLCDSEQEGMVILMTDSLTHDVTPVRVEGSVLHCTVLYSKTKHFLSCAPL